MEREWSEFWWNNITGANYLVSKVTDTLLNNMPAVLIVPSDLPWRYQMRGAVESEFRKKVYSSDIIVDMVDAVDECASYTNPGRFLLEHYGQNPEVRNGYRARSKKTIQDYLLGKKVLKNKIIWVKGLSGKQAKSWISFCSSFMPENIGEGQFVLEIHGLADTKNYEPIIFDKYINKYDVQLFDSFILNVETMLSATWKNYIATVAAALCDFDAEISELFIDMLDVKKDDPIDVVMRIAEMEEFSRRGGEENSEHLLSYARRRKMKYLRRRLWSAQVKVLFPLIEMERVDFIDERYDLIQQALRKNEIIQYKDQISEPFEVELGTLVYMMSHKSEDGLYMLHIPQVERERIRFLHECRNKLAHSTCCETELVVKLIDK